ncbi:hypothetical protein [Corynebacterium kalidii]
MARHSAPDSTVRVAGWVWAAVVAVLLVVAVVVGWFVLVGSQRDDEAGDACIDGEQELTVWADPAAEEVARTLAESYNAGEHVVRDRCVTAVVEVMSTAEATAAYRRVEPGVAPVWIPAGTGFIPGLSGAPETVEVVGTDELVHVVPAGADPEPSAAVLPTGAESMVSALAAEAVGRGAPPEQPGPDLPTARGQNLPVLTAAGLLDGAGDRAEDVRTVGEVVFPLVAFGSSPAVDEKSARAAADFASRADGADSVTSVAASPSLTETAGALAGVPLNRARNGL